MNAPPAWLPELHDLLDLLYEDRLSELDCQRLNELLASGKEQRNCYITYMDVHSYLAWNGVQPTLNVGREPMAGEDRREAMGHAGCSRATARRSVVPPTATTRYHPHPHLPLHHPPQHPRLFPEGMPLAYLVATVVTGLGLLIASHVYVSRPEQVARTSVPAAVVEPKAEMVGRITGMVDCKWNGGSRVSLGQKYELASGLMEITYDTGAKVILQGPVTYSVETNGGYLAVGKLTGKLEKEWSVVSGQWSVNQQSTINNQQSLIPNP